MGEPSEIQATVVLITLCGVEVVAGRIDVGCPDLALIEALMRLQLAAKRRGWRVCLRDPPVELAALLELVGLADQLTAPGEPPTRPPRPPPAWPASRTRRTAPDR